MPRRPDLTDLAIVFAAFAGAFFTSPHDGSFVVTVVFATTVLTAFGLVARLGVETGRGALAQSRRTRALGVIDPREAARQAVLAERARLSSDVDACIRDALRQVAREVHGRVDGEDPRPRARRIHAHAREASTELRRQLGLLRAAEKPEGAHPEGAFGGDELAGQLAADGRAEDGVAGLPARRDLLLGGASAVLAAVEAVTIGNSEIPGGFGALSVILTVLAAATLAVRRVGAPWGALVCAGFFGIGWLLPDVQVSSGAWMLCTLGGLVWALGAARQTVLTISSALVLFAMACGSRLDEDPDNAGILIVTLVVAWSIGAAVGRNRNRQDSEATQAAALQATLDAARDRAVRAERLATARDLHDVVSHAVGVIAAQAAAAEVSWPGHPATSRRAMAAVAETVERAMAELERARGGATTGPSTDPGAVPGAVPALEGWAGPTHDLDALVTRMQAAGTSVTLNVEVVPPRLGQAVYRIVQECLTNAVRHAPGAAIDVRVECREDEVMVRVSDDGPGPPPSLTPGAAGGFGLTGLRERVGLLGGTLRIVSPPDGGFVVEARLPMREAVDA